MRQQNSRGFKIRNESGYILRWQNNRGSKTKIRASIEDDNKIASDTK